MHAQTLTKAYARFLLAQCALYTCEFTADLGKELHVESPQ